MPDEPTLLLDASVLIPLVLAEHEHHEIARRWAARTERMAVCPIVEGALSRTMVRLGETWSTARATLRAIHDRPGVDFWPDAISYRDIELASIRGHRQLTDAYLVALAISRDSKLATLDRGLAAAHPDGTILLNG